MKLHWFIALGAGPDQAGLIFAGLLVPFIAVVFGIRARSKKKGVSAIGIVASLIALLPSAFTLQTYGLPWTWDDWGAYIPLLPLTLLLVGLILNIQKKRIQTQSHPAGGSS